MWYACRIAHRTSNVELRHLKKSVINVDFRYSKKLGKSFVTNGIRTHAHISGPDLESGALDRSATLTVDKLKLDLGFILFGKPYVEPCVSNVQDSLQVEHLICRRV